MIIMIKVLSHPYGVEFVSSTFQLDLFTALLIYEHTYIQFLIGVKVQSAN